MPRARSPGYRSIDESMYTPPPGWITAAQAVERLGVKRRTLYTYASRGWIRTAPGPDGRSRLYSEPDVDELEQRAIAARGRGAVAAAALRWGEPVIDSAITRIDGEGPHYRGRSAVRLVEEGAPFEAVADRLWDAAPGPWTDRPPPKVSGLGGRALDRLLCALPQLAQADPDRHVRVRTAEIARARRLVPWFACWVTGAPQPEGSIASTLAAGWDLEASAVPLLDAALIVIADHELNASTFAARVAASTGADLYACLQAALAAFSGPLHGGSCDRIEAFFQRVPSPEAAAAFVRQALARGEPLPLVDPKLYPYGDPRARALVAACEEMWGARTPLAVLAAVRELGFPPPVVDAALVCLALGLGLPRGSATALFAIGRAAGWIAHVLEQREGGSLIRPRARYTGAM